MSIRNIVLVLCFIAIAGFSHAGIVKGNLLSFRYFSPYFGHKRLEVWERSRHAFRIVNMGRILGGMAQRRTQNGPQAEILSVFK
jgi:hypothetical protein